MKTFTGRIIDPLNLKTSDIDIVDIAHHLSLECRFAGATPHHYSVAQHSVYVAVEYTQCDVPDPAIAENGQDGWWNACHARHKLLHDASEAYLRDIPRPLKCSAVFKAYRELEKEVQAIIYTCFGLAPDMPPCVKEADNMLLVSEGVALMNERYTDFGPPSRRTIERWEPSYAKDRFLNAFRNLFLLDGKNAW